MTSITRPRMVFLLLVWFVIGANPAMAGEIQVSGFTAADFRWFPQSPKFNGQFSGVDPSVLLNPEFRYQANDNGPQITFIPFVRLSGRDAHRTHFDIREAYVSQRLNNWDYLIGVNKVFWGVAESRHLVNIINQSDAVENTNNEDKLGQPMLNIGVQKDWGRLDVFFLPGFRKRPFSGSTGRLRTKETVDNKQAVFERRTGNPHMDFAGRYSHFIGEWDIGVSLFHGLSREPRLPIGANGRRAPHYDQITQAGLDLQYTADAWLWKFEGIVREGHGDPFAATVGGFEYTFFQVAESAADIGLLAELHWDGRNQRNAPATNFNNDLFIGSRFALNDVNDSQALIGSVIDAKDGTTSLSIKADRRVGDIWKIKVDARFQIKSAQKNISAPFKRDSYINLRLARYF